MLAGIVINSDNLDCGPELRQSEFGRSSTNGEEDVRRAETKMGPLFGRVPAQALERMKTCDNVKALAKELGVARQRPFHQVSEFSNVAWPAKRATGR